MRRRLLEDGSLEIRATAAVRDRVEPWLPRLPGTAPQGPPRARIEVSAQDGEFDRPDAPPLIQLGSVDGWSLPQGRILLHSAKAGLSGVVDPAAMRSEIRFGPVVGSPEAERVEVFAILTLATAFLLGRLGRTLVHGAAVVPPDGKAWLLVGGTFSGKTTSCVNLIRHGWDYLTDDHIVLADGPGGLWIEGWPRRFNLDEGYSAGRSVGIRIRVDPERFGPGRWRRTAPVRGLLFPTVRPGAPTALASASPRQGLPLLLRQSPWLLADPGTAGDVLGLLTSAALLPSFNLTLGEDSYRAGERLAALLRSAEADPPRVLDLAGHGE